MDVEGFTSDLYLISAICKKCLGKENMCTPHVISAAVVPQISPFSELETSLALRRGLNRYLYVLMAQQAASAACLRFHQIGPRLARWLLMSQDRAHASGFHVTQEFLAYMLGVRRVGVTAAAGVLQRGGLIEYSRGELTVLDRAGLEHAACSCYAADRKAYTDLLG